MKKLLVVVGIIGISAVLFAQAPTVPTRVIDGQAVFAVAKVNNEIAWSQEKKDDLIATMTFASMTAPVVLTYTPSSFELRISTTFKFKSYSGYLETLEMTNQELTDAETEVNRSKRTKNFKKETKD